MCKVEIMAWFSKECFNKLTILINKTEDKKVKCKLQKLLEYLVNNEDILVNYGERKFSNLSFTSNIAESIVENLVNSRYRQTGKMQWKREGAHTLLQVRAASYSSSSAKTQENITLGTNFQKLYDFRINYYDFEG